MRKVKIFQFYICCAIRLIIVPKLGQLFQFIDCFQQTSSSYNEKDYWYVCCNNVFHFYCLFQ